MRNKILTGVMLGIITLVLTGMGWHYVYIPHKEMTTLLPLKEKMVKLYTDNNIYPFPPGKPENVQKYMGVSIAVTGIKRELHKESASLSTEKARKTSALLIKTANEFEKLCKISASIERELFPESANKPTTKEFEKNLDTLEVLKSELEDKLFPQLEGHFNK